MKNLIFVFLFISSISFAQSDWSAVKYGSTDMSKIYVGSTLVWEKSDTCEYGNLDNYELLLQDLRISASFDSCSYVNIADAASGKLAIDRIRDSGCYYVGGSFSSGALIDKTNIQLGDYLLDYSDPLKCVLYNYKIDDWFIVRIDGDFPVNETPIIHVENGVITYVEYY